MKTAPFNIGDRVVVVSAAGDNPVLPLRSEWTVLGIKPAECKCGHWWVDVGFTYSQLFYQACVKCGYSGPVKTGSAYFDHMVFALIEPRHQSVSIECDISEMYPATKETVEAPVKEKI